MYYSKSDIIDLGLNQFSELQIKRSLEAFNGIAKLFGREFIDKRFNGNRVPAEVVYITELYENWKLVEQCKNSVEIIKRWKEGLYKEGVDAELYIFAHLIKSGIIPELFPCIENKKSDCRFMKNSQWIYLEVTHRQRSKMFIKGLKITSEIAKIAGKTAKGKHAKVAILRFPTDEELERIINWLYNIGNTNDTKLDDLAYLYLDAKRIYIRKDDKLIEKVDLQKDDKLRKLLPPCSLYAVAIDADKDTIGTAGLYIEDNIAQEIFRRESRQLPKGSPGIICIDTSSPNCEYKKWIPLIKRRFQPKINKRISAVLLFTKSLTNRKVLVSGCYLSNPFANYCINDNLKNIFEKLFNNN